MTRKVTRKIHTLRVLARLFGVFPVLIALAALAQITGAARPSRRLRPEPLKRGALSQGRGYAVPAKARGLGRAAGTHVERNRHVAMVSNPPIFLPTVAYNSGGPNAIAVAVADVNGDGRPDLLVVNECGRNNCGTSSLGVLRGKGDGTFGKVTIHRSIGSYAVALGVADLNRDGKPDLVVVNTLSSTVETLLVTATQPFSQGSFTNRAGFTPLR